MRRDWMYVLPRLLACALLACTIVAYGELDCDCDEQTWEMVCEDYDSADGCPILEWVPTCDFEDAGCTGEIPPVDFSFSCTLDECETPCSTDPLYYHSCVVETENREDPYMVFFPGCSCSCSNDECACIPDPNDIEWSDDPMCHCDESCCGCIIC